MGEPLVGSAFDPPRRRVSFQEQDAGGAGLVEEEVTDGDVLQFIARNLTANARAAEMVAARPETETAEQKASRAAWDAAAADTATAPDQAIVPAVPEPQKGQVIEHAILTHMTPDGRCPGELKELPEDYGAVKHQFSQLRYLPEDYNEAEIPRQKADDPKPTTTIWSEDFHNSSAQSVGDVLKSLPGKEKLKDIVHYKGPFKKDTVMKQATVNAELEKATKNGDADRVAALLRFGMVKRCVNVNAPLWPKRERLLHLAARGNHRDIALMLLEAKAEIDIEEISDGRHPIHDACKHGAYDVVELLLDRKARIEENTFTGMRPLHWASAAGKAEVVDLLLDRSAKMHAQRANGYQAIHEAAANGHAEAVRVLLKRGAKVDVDARDMKPLHLACMSGHMKAAAILLDFGAMGILDEFCEKGPLHKYAQTPLEELMRQAETLRFQRDEAEELHDMGQEEEAKEAFQRVIEGFMSYGLVNSAKTALEDGRGLGIQLEMASFDS
eukprot:gnl/TRDRNA2_/TRDRNA2_181702_c0_seq1.p1 gnl/TRDRNA2_/TRDRNA2_181702_c0~~gnl/TRDRNA2_/TRDRNA2_181702_c0_seq1.p1  ORF type:complete len:510 (-),score=133.24 gnl/TRDRNA2_/TRDRNA2_181702_c0_seq1:92-1585(-)